VGNPEPKGLAGGDDVEDVGGEGNVIVANKLGNPGDSGKRFSSGTAKPCWVAMLRAFL
jgi:hypothetical protein